VYQPRGEPVVLLRPGEKSVVHGCGSCW
jgi:hypothetical protein